MGNIVIQIDAVEYPGSRFFAFGKIAAFGYRLGGRRRLEKMAEYGAVVDFRFRPAPLDLYPGQGFFRHIRILVEDGNQIAVPHDFNAVHFLRCREIDAFQLGAMRRRA